MELKEQLITARETAGLTQKEVAEYLGVKVSTYAHYEAGRRVPDLEKIKLLNELFGINIYLKFPINEITKFSQTERENLEDLLKKSAENLSSEKSKDELRKNLGEIENFILDWQGRFWGPEIEDLQGYIASGKILKEYVSVEVSILDIQLMREAEKMREKIKKYLNLV